MLFRAHGPKGATVYMLGSVHLLSPDVATLPSVVDTAFTHAKLIAFETSLDTIQMRATEMLSRSRYSGGATLRTSLSPKAIAHLDTVLKAYGLTVDQVNGFKPWFVSVLTTQLVMQRMKFEAKYGVDMQLNARAHTANMPIVGLESVDFQMGLFDSILPADQEKMILEANGPDSSVRSMTRIKDAWVAGNVAGLDSLLNAGMVSSPAMFATMVTNRNRSWIPKIDEMLKGKDDALVVVGAAHLVGKQGVIEMLRAKGYKIEQM
ncbi:MAG TPA: TraB/GumN family protein [Gemmatimonadaceae bacterium]|nr:TraB/GumN family protein [Gemmatimonadaceae bacterium]